MPHKRIFLQWHGDADPEIWGHSEPTHMEEVTWCKEKIFDLDIEYIRADVVDKLVEAAGRYMFAITLIGVSDKVSPDMQESFETARFDYYSALKELEE